MKCEKDMKERLRNAVIFIEFQSFKDLYVYVTSNLEKKKKKKKVLRDLFIKVSAKLPKQVYQQNDGKFIHTQI